MAIGERNQGGCFELLPGVVWQPLDDGVMLLDTAKGQYFELNPSGSRMFELLLRESSVAAVAERLLIEFDTDLAQLRPDLDALIEELEQAALIRPVRPAESRS